MVKRISYEGNFRHPVLNVELSKNSAKYAIIIYL